MRATITIPTPPTVLQDVNTELDRRELTVVAVPDRPLRPLVPEGPDESAFPTWEDAIASMLVYLAVGLALGVGLTVLVTR